MAGATVSFPIIADANRHVATLYDMLDALDPTNRDALGMPLTGSLPLTVRDVFFIDPLKMIRAKISYPASTGRHFGEILRVIDSLQLVDNHPVTTPADWQPGDRVIVHPNLSDEEAHSRFPDLVSLKPYLRLASNPDS